MASQTFNDQSEIQILMHVLEQKGMSSTVYDYSTLIEDLKKPIIFTFRLHIYKSHTENSQYTCQSCAQDFYDLKKFVLHQIKLHAERSGDQIFCLACRRPYTKSHSLQVHMIRKSEI